MEGWTAEFDSWDLCDQWCAGAAHSGALRPAFLFAAISETVSRMTGKPASARVEGIHTFREPHPLSSAKAIGELGVSFRPLHETMRDTVA
ncbi:MAG: hypothetical protein HC822_14850 [Oscillochloris sp.]|nr:hypothetical protein [Oscillochloris sp.]